MGGLISREGKRRQKLFCSSFSVLSPRNVKGSGGKLCPAEDSLFLRLGEGCGDGALQGFGFRGPPRFYAHRASGGDCHHRDLDGTAAAGSPEGARGGCTPPVPEQPQAVRAG